MAAVAGLESKHCGEVLRRARRVHNPDAAGSTPAPANQSTNYTNRRITRITETEADLGPAAKPAVSLHRSAGPDRRVAARSGTIAPARSDYSAALPALFAAMRQVESADGAEPIGDGGKSRGDYHITRAYWTDACEQGGVDWDYDTLVWSRSHCERIVTWYWQRYCPDALAAGDRQTLARVHNGGPSGHLKTATRKYWRRVKAAIGDGGYA